MARLRPDVPRARRVERDRGAGARGAPGGGVERLRAHGRRFHRRRPVRTQAFAAYAGAALTNLDVLQDARELAEGLQKAMEFRSVIEQAKGVLIERNKLTADQAFRPLAEASMHTNRKVRDVAEDLVLTGELEPRPPAPAAGDDG